MNKAMEISFIIKNNPELLNLAANNIQFRSSMDTLSCNFNLDTIIKIIAGLCKNNEEITKELEETIARRNNIILNTDGGHLNG